MAASEFDRGRERSPSGEGDLATAGALYSRLEEEVERAERQGTGLSCMLLVLENLDEIKRRHGEELGEQVIEYVAEALRPEMRRFDRVCRASERELAVIAPGAHGAHGEILARRVLARMRAIKIEAGGSRLPLRVSVGLAAWGADMSARALMSRARAALESLEADATTSSAEREELGERDGLDAGGGAPPQSPRSPQSPAVGRRAEH